MTEDSNQRPSRELTAAMALGEEARRRAVEPILPETAAAPAPAAGETAGHLLIEGECGDVLIAVPTPAGEIWRYHAPCGEPGRIVLLCIDLAAPSTALVFRPTPEGVHPFLGTARRVGVERSVA